MINYKIKPLNLIVHYMHFKMCPQWYRFCISLSTNYEGFNLLAVIVSFQSKMLYLFFSFHFFFCTLLTTGIYKRFFLLSFFPRLPSDMQMIFKLWTRRASIFWLVSCEIGWNHSRKIDIFTFSILANNLFFAFSKDWIKVKWFLCFSFDEVNKRSQVATRYVTSINLWALSNARCLQNCGINKN